MTKFFTNTFPIINLHKKTSTKSEIVSQMIYGESFSVVKKLENGLKLELKRMAIKGL